MDWLSVIGNAGCLWLKLKVILSLLLIPILIIVLVLILKIKSQNYYTVVGTVLLSNNNSIRDSYIDPTTNQNIEKNITISNTQIQTRVNDPITVYINKKNRNDVSVTQPITLGVKIFLCFGILFGIFIIVIEAFAAFYDKDLC